MNALVTYLLGLPVLNWTQHLFTLRAITAERDQLTLKVAALEIKLANSERNEAHLTAEVVALKHERDESQSKAKKKRDGYATN
jgi:uncharacterized coiled-coil DUF342 family protein